MLRPMIVDAFTYMASKDYRKFHYNFRALALEQMDTLRRARGYRARWYVVPDELNRSLAAYQTYEQQVRVTPGSYLWGWSYAEASLAAVDPIAHLRITEQATNIALMDDFVVGASVGGGNTGAIIDAPFMLTEPRLVLEPGFLNVEMTNPSGTVSFPQLVLYLAEPCEYMEYGGGCEQ